MKKLLLALVFLVSFAFSAVNLNTATKKELMTLDGIGDKKAEEIIKYREKTPFKKPEDIKNIKGVGDKLFDKIKDKIEVKQICKICTYFSMIDLTQKQDCANLNTSSNKNLALLLIAQSTYSRKQSKIKVFLFVDILFTNLFW